ncbi:MAG: Ig-like domain-containing protein [Bacteroidales bacterium]|nr:Ig-like domain-containing protein [Bacteroidales bacterium]
MKRFLSIFAFAAGLILAACTPKEQEIAVTGVKVEPTSVTLEVGETTMLKATVEPADATDKGVNWSSSNMSVAAVQDGTVVAIAPGSATIIVTTVSGGKTATCSVTVKEKGSGDKDSIKGISLSPESAKVEVGGTLELTVVFDPESASDSGLKWKSSKEEVATVKDGVVSGVALGEAVISVTTSDGKLTAKCDIQVVDKYVKVESVTVSEESLMLTVGETHSLTATVMPENATSPELVWASDAPGIASVDNDGTVKALNAGAAVIEVHAADNPEAKALCNVTVEAVKVKTVKLSDYQVSLKEGETSKAIKVSFDPEDAGDKSFSVASSAPSIAEAAKVSDTEFSVKGITGGVAEITVTSPDGPSAVLIAKVIPAIQEVDLGLPSGVKWASFNIGATAPEDYGNLYAWGETTPKEKYSSDNYVFGLEPFSKYNDTDNKIYLDPEDDAATAMYGDGWRTPAVVEVRELRDKCTWEWTEVNGVKGQKVTGPNGKSLFLPAAGFARNNETVDKNAWGDYMLLEKFISPFNFSSSGFGNIKNWSGSYYYGYSVRAVKGSYVQVKSLKLDVTTIENLGPAKAKIRATVQPSNATDKLVEWSSSDTEVAKVDQEGNVDILKKGLATISARCSGFVAACEIISAYSYAEPEKVDLGLPSGTLWASCNLGAWEPEEIGAYFAWGETEPKGVFSSSNYKLRNSTKYEYGKNPEVLQPEDDAAHVKLGGKWRIPTSVETQELMNLCEFKYDNSKKTWTVTGPNGKSILLPSTGWYDYELNSSLYCYFLASNLYKNSNAYAAYLSAFEHGTVSVARYYGRTIRPVWADPYPTITKLELDKHQMAPKAGATVQLTATTSPEQLSPKHLIWESNFKDRATVDGNGLVTIHSEGRATITVSTIGGIGKDVFEIVPEYKYTQPEEIDLGLPSGLKWAACNLGAASPKEDGAYFAWGETSTKMQFTKDNYKWGVCDADENMTKYNNKDGKTILEPEDDAAHVILGGDWRMPTMDELLELSQGCTWELSNGANGKYFTGTSKYNSKTIIIPLSGLYYDGQFSNYALNVYLWSSEPYTNWYKMRYWDPYYYEAQYLIISDSYINTEFGFDKCYPWSFKRYVGSGIRPVKGKGLAKSSARPVARTSTRRAASRKSSDSYSDE